MDAIISPARMRAAGLSKFLRLALPQAVRVTVVGFALFGLAAVVAASASDTVSYGELCSLLVASMTLTGFLFASCEWCAHDRHAGAVAHVRHSVYRFSCNRCRARAACACTVGGTSRRRGQGC